MTAPNPHRGFCFPAEVIEHAVWLHHRFSLSLRDVETILAARGVAVSCESIRERGLRFGRLFASTLKRRRPKPGDKWFMDEVFLRIRGKLRYLWRAVDQHGHVLDILVQSRRNARAAKRFFRKLPKGLQCVPRVLVTDKLRSYAAAKREVLPGVEHRQSRCLNNRAPVSFADIPPPVGFADIPPPVGFADIPPPVSFADIPPGDRCATASRQPTRRRERQMQRLKSARHAQRLLSAHSRVRNHFQLRRHRLTANQHRAARDGAFRAWREVAGVAAVA